jgi:preprotein translocase subunit Sec63
MATQPDYYRILQVHPGAEREVVDAAYRRLAAKYHPDVSHDSNTEERMKQINAAYEVLSDPVRRAAYDAARGVAPSPDTPPQPATTSSQNPIRPWRILLIAMGLILLSVVVVRLGPALLRLVVPLVVISLVVWLIFTMNKPRR